MLARRDIEKYAIRQGISCNFKAIRAPGAQNHNAPPDIGRSLLCLIGLCAINDLSAYFAAARMQARFRTFNIEIPFDEIVLYSRLDVTLNGSDDATRILVAVVARAISSRADDFARGFRKVWDEISMYRVEGRHLARLA